MESIKQKAMSIYMDRHNVSESVTAEHVAQLHQEDLKVQHNYGCTGLTYWFDEKRKMAFCLIEAPNEQAVNNMHNHAHGEVPHSIIEVDANLVESFLGRIEDPGNASDTKLNIIDDPAFRTIMVVELQKLSLAKNHLFQNANKSIANIFENFNGRIVKQRDNYYLVSFESVSKAVSCALEVQSKLKKFINEIGENNLKLKIGLSSGIPVTETASIFEDTIKLAERMCNITEAEIVVSSEVKDLYKSENLNVFIHGEEVFTLTPSDEKFLTLLMDYTDETWKNTGLKVDDFSKHLGYSKSQLYRKMISLTKKSPNTFLKEYRLTQALKLLNEQKGNISEIAFETGFNSLSYFSKCFQKRYNLLPSDYLSANVL
jgi:AraC-like DNA-binding protein